MLRSILLLCVMVFVAGCSGVDRGTLKLPGIKSGAHVHVGEGLYMIIPPGYLEANSYYGFQAPNYVSSISVEIIDHTVETIASQFDEKLLEAQNKRLEVFNSVNYQDSLNGVFTVIKDGQKKATRFLLALPKMEKSIAIKAFYRSGLKDKYHERLMRSFQSIFIEETQKEKGEYFKMAKLFPNGTLISTRDGKFPTESKDSVYLEVRTVENFNEDLPINILNKYIDPISGTKGAMYHESILSDGMIYKATASGNGKFVVCRLIKQDGMEARLVMYYGNSKMDRGKIESNIVNSILDIQLK